VRDEKGAKMSKSKGNVIDPLELIDDYGADALRFTLAAMAAQGRDIKLVAAARRGLPQLRDQAVERRPLRRDERLRAAVPGFDPAKAKETLNRWIAHETARATREVTEAIEAYRFNDAAARSIASSGTSIATGISNSPSPCCMGRTAPPRPRPAPWSPGRATRSSSCCIRSCRSSPRSGEKLCRLVLEPLRRGFGHITVRSAYRSPSLNHFCNERYKAGDKACFCSDNEYNFARHIWDRRDEHGYLGATASVVVPAYLDFYERTGDHKPLAWWIRDHVEDYDEVAFYPAQCAFNIRWYEGPSDKVIRRWTPEANEILTRRDMANFAGDHRALYEDALAGILV
jgi:hypothetical protein